VRNGENGYVLENDAQMFARRISEILEDEQKCKTFGDRSLQIFREELTVERMVEGYMKIYERVASQNGRRR
jgi:glycosyltransferase involved in cell wall biosynthesis